MTFQTIKNGVVVQKCNICKKCFPTEHLLTQHKKKHSKQYNCQLCNGVFYSNRGLQAHLHVHTGKKPYKCKTCGKSFAFSSILKKHEFTHCGEKPHKCLICSAAFAQKCNLEAHKQTHNALRQMYTCSWKSCGKKFTTSNHRKRHENTHSEERPLKCSVCSASFKLKVSLNRHLATHSNTTYLCPQCPKKYRDRGGLQTHLKNHHEPSFQRQVFDCIFCEKTFQTSTGCATHLIAHVGEKPFNCGICDMEFSRKGERDQHLKRRHILERPFACGICEHRCITQSELKSHSRTHLPSGGPRLHDCIFCGKDFHRNGELMNHIRSHVKEKAHSCIVCGMEFCSSFDMQNHIKRKHTNDKQFACQFCEKAYVRRRGLKRHLATKHAN